MMIYPIHNIERKRDDFIVHYNEETRELEIMDKEHSKEYNISLALIFQSILHINLEGEVPKY